MTGEVPVESHQESEVETSEDGYVSDETLINEVYAYELIDHESIAGLAGDQIIGDVVGEQDNGTPQRRSPRHFQRRRQRHRPRHPPR